MGRQIQNDRPKVVAKKSVGIRPDGVEGDVAEVEQAGEADDDVQAPAQHDVGQDQDAEVDPVARLVQPAGRQRGEQRVRERDPEKERDGQGRETAADARWFMGGGPNRLLARLRAARLKPGHADEPHRETHSEGQGAQNQHQAPARSQDQLVRGP